MVLAICKAFLLHVLLGLQEHQYTGDPSTAETQPLGWNALAVHKVHRGWKCILKNKSAQSHKGKSGWEVGTIS